MKYLLCLLGWHRWKTVACHQPEGFFTPLRFINLCTSCRKRKITAEPDDAWLSVFKDKFEEIQNRPKSMKEEVK